jgi:membrane carboxypeptidase/penicillin-binding protein
VHIREGGTGSRLALPIWAEFMRRAGGSNGRTFSPPDGMRVVELCHVCFGGRLSDHAEYFKASDAIPSALPDSRQHQAARQTRHRTRCRGLLGSLWKRLQGVNRTGSA